jgi:transcriptional regulator with XRE-family HTH domain
MPVARTKHMNIYRIMNFRDMSHADLARKLKVSRPAVTQMLEQDANLTLNRIKKIAEALDCELRIEFIPKEIS